MTKSDIEEWIVKNVGAFVVPRDEGNDDGLIYNLVHLLWDGEDFIPYDYKEYQDAEIKILRGKYK